MNLILKVLCAGFILVSCSRPNHTPYVKANSDLHRTVRIAKGFEITQKEHSNIITIKNPWQHALGIQYEYLLSDSLKKSSIISEYRSQIKTPVKRVICLSTTHIGYISYLGKAGTVKGISGSKYVINDSIRRGMAANEVLDVGYDENLNFELILKLKPDIVFAYGVNVSITNTVKKLNEIGIPVMLIGEYLEEDPLAKMEWIKVFGACYGVQEEANQKFDSVEIRYNALKALAEKEKNKPTVLLGLPWRGTWYISGSQSYIARLVTDAGGTYIWQNTNFNESVPMALEKVFENALSAEYWLNPGEARSIRDIISVDERFKSLPAIQSEKVFNNDNQLSPTGGNAFYEAGVIEPDIILSDLIFILHPHLLPSYHLKYYRKL